MSKPAERRLVHRRSMSVHVFRVGDGRWEAIAEVVDIKSRDYPIGDRVVRAGQPLHHMRIRLIVNSDFDVLDADARTLAAPYPGDCDDDLGRYRELVGLNLARGFSRALSDRFHGEKGCTHISELARTLPTAVMIAVRGDMGDPEADTIEQPRHVGRCRGLRLDGPVVRSRYPRWAITPQID